SFANADDTPRRVTCIAGGAGTGKTSVATALASTRPGHAIVLPRYGARGASAPAAFADWLTGQDDSSRPHALRVGTPGALMPGESEDSSAHRRREQAIYERKAGDGGFVFMGLPGCR